MIADVHIMKARLALSVSCSALMLFSTAVSAEPTLGNVEAGVAEVSSGVPNLTQITQTSDKAVLNWQNFDVAADETVEFRLPSASSVTLNRDISGNTSEIFGRVSSNGQFFLVNPNGILFAPGSRVDVAALVASTHDIDTDAFMRGDYTFDREGLADASITNAGNVTVADMGFAAFVAPHVRNDGLISARLGKVELSSARGYTLDLYGDGLISFLMPGAEATGIARGSVANTGSIIADGGRIALTAQSARAAIDNVINVDGLVQANTVEKRGGKIVLGGGETARVAVSGKVEAKGNDQGEQGGEVFVLGRVLSATAGSSINASGQAGGGKVLFGGDYLGGKATNAEVAKYGIAMEAGQIPTAEYSFLEFGAEVRADGLEQGDGGKVIVWSDGLTMTAASISAKGGALSGNGGFVETSGEELHALLAADTSASNGEAGTWLLDPLNITIDRPSAANTAWFSNAGQSFPLLFGGSFTATAYRPSAIGSVISTSVIESALNSGGNVVVTTYGTVGSGTGDISLLADVNKSSGGASRFALLAADDVTIGAGVDVRSTAGALIFEANAAEGEIIATNVGQFSLRGGALVLVSRDGVRLSSTFDMPNTEVLLNNSSSTRRSVNLTFGDDRVRVGYTNTIADLAPGAISLLDATAQGTLFIGFANAVNARLDDRSIVGLPNRVWELAPTSSAGVYEHADLNGIPEIEGFADPFWTMGAEPGNGFVPVIEVSSLRDGSADPGSEIVTAPSGNAALRNFRLRRLVQNPIDQIAKVTGLFELASAKLGEIIPSSQSANVVTSALPKVVNPTISSFASAYLDMGLEALAATSRNSAAKIYNTALAPDRIQLVLSQMKDRGNVEPYVSGSYSIENSINSTLHNWGVAGLRVANAFSSTAKALEFRQAALDLVGLPKTTLALFDILPDAAAEVSSMSGADIIKVYGAISKFSLDPVGAAQEISASMDTVSSGLADIMVKSAAGTVAERKVVGATLAYLNDVVVTEMLRSNQALEILAARDILTSAVARDPSLLSNPEFLDMRVPGPENWWQRITPFTGRMTLRDAIRAGVYSF